MPYPPYSSFDQTTPYTAFSAGSNRQTTPATTNADGSPHPVADEQAIADAETAVAKLTNPSAYLSQTIYDWVFNESRAGRWANVFNVVIPRTNSDSALTDLKGSITPVNNGGTYTNQEGYRLTPTNYIDSGISLAAVSATGREPKFGIYLESFVNGSGVNYALGVNASDQNSGLCLIAFSEADNNGVSGYNSFANAQYPNVSLAELTGTLLSVEADASNVTLRSGNGTDVVANTAIQPDNPTRTMHINSLNAGSPSATVGTMSVGFYFAGTAGLDLDGFTTSVNQLMIDLSQTS